MPAGEKTEAATPRKKHELRQKGQVARSQEVSAIAAMLGSLIALRFTAGGMVTNFREFIIGVFSRAGTIDLGPYELQSETIGALIAAAKISGPLLLAAAVGAVVGGASQVGFLISAHPIKPEFARLNPLKGLTRIFSIQAAVQLAKSLAKALVVGYIIFAFLRSNMLSVVGMSGIGLDQMGTTTGKLMWGLLIRTSIALAIVAGFDYLFRRYQFEKENRMTKEEVKEEYKRTEGDPHVKSRRRQRMREIIRHRMMQEVSKATVVVTNPTHIAVALRYTPEEMSAPKVVAKGERLIAERIKQIARDNRVPVVENVPLARALNKHSKVGELVPADLYQAVAEVLAFVYRMSGNTNFSRD